MLPSTGYFKGINCPFYDSGLCERPYCHFRHVKKECQSLSNEGIESGAILQQLVSEAVKKVLQQTEASSSPNSAQIASNNVSSSSEITTNPPPQKVTYNPTPISELKKINNTDTENEENEQRKRHIPVPYTPRKPAGLPIKRAIDTDGEPKLYVPPPVKYLPGRTEGVVLDPYTPVGGTESNEKYLPGTEAELQEYKPAETESSNKHNYVPSDKNASKTYLPGTGPEIQEYKIEETKSSSRTNYVPSDKSVSKKKVLEYKPAKVKPKSDTPVVTYQPTPRSQVPCFSSDEDEPDTKKRKLSTDLNGLDELGAEFDMLGEILEEEDDTKKVTSTSKEVLQCNEGKTKNHIEQNKDRKSCSDKHDQRKLETVKKEKSSKKNTKEKHESKSKHSDKKSSHKSSKDRDKKKETKDKNRESKERDKHREGKERDKHEESEKQRERSKHKESKEGDKHKDSKECDKHKESDKHRETKEKGKHKESKGDDLKKSKEDKIRESKDREKEKKRHKDTESKLHSSSRSSNKISNSSEKSSKNSEKHSKHSSSSKSESEEKRDKHKNHKTPNKSSKGKHKNKDSRNEGRHKERYEKVFQNLSDNDDFDNRNNLSDELCEEESESDEEAIALECKRIFEEYVPTEKPKILEELPSKDQHVDPDEYIPSKKRISRTLDKNVKVIPKEPIKPDYKVSAAQKMAERLAKVREYHASKTAPATIENSVTNFDTVKNASTTPSSSGKIRIAHVPYASYLMNAKKTISTKSVADKSEASTSTITQTVKKGTTRVAHMPNEKFIDRPGVLEPLASKIPANIRSTYLNMMIDECVKIYLAATDAYARAQHEELATSKKCKTIQIYKNSAVLTVSRLRKELVECNGVKKSGSDCTTLQRIPGAITGTSTNANAGSWSIENKSKRAGDISHEFRGSKFFENISKWILTEEQLQENGFPRPHPSGDKGRAMIYAQNNKQKPPQGVYRTCVRCKQEYSVDKKGFPVLKEECIYHPNNKYRFRGEVKYQCCSQDGTSDGCCVAPNHVYEYVDYENLKGYVRTMPPVTEKDDYGVYSLDCEMCYTTKGLDLTRITVINSNCQVVYETLILPLHSIIDYNTRYSGITEEQMAGVRTTLLDVQATLLTMFNSKTILIGHSLESDFKALKLIHDTVIDTSVLFPHKMGPPYKRALRNLSSEYLKKIIQNSVDGHDSAEDATVCMELIHFKLKEDLKTR